MTVSCSTAIANAVGAALDQPEPGSSGTASLAVAATYPTDTAFIAAFSVASGSPTIGPFGGGYSELLDVPGAPAFKVGFLQAPAPTTETATAPWTAYGDGGVLGVNVAIPSSATAPEQDATGGGSASLPSTPTPGNIVVMVCHTWGGNVINGPGATGPTTGWTLIGSVSNVATLPVPPYNGIHRGGISVYARCVQPGEAGLYDFTISGGFPGNLRTYVAEFVGVTDSPPPVPEIYFTINSVEFRDLIEKTIRVELNGSGSGAFRISRGNPDATEANLTPGNIVSVTIPEIDPDPIFEFVLETGDFGLVSSDEEGGEILSFGGPGTLSLLARARMDYEQYVTATTLVHPSRGVWKFLSTWSAGSILWRIIAEAQDPDRPDAPLGGITRSFTDTHDTDAVAWADSLDDAWIIPIGLDLYEAALRLVRGEYLSIEMAPGLVLNAYQSQGTDRSSTSFGAGKVRFVKGVNIVSELVRSMQGRSFASHGIVRTADGDYTRTSLDPGTYPYVSEAYFEIDSTDATNIARKLAKRQMKLRLDAQEALLLGVRTPWPGDGNDEGSGIYLPGPPWSANGKYWVGDLVTLHTGTGDYDYDNETFQVYAITLTEDETGYLAPPVVELNAPYMVPDDDSTGVASSLASPSGGSTGGGGSPTPNLSAYLEAELDTWKQTVRVATTANITISTALNAGDVIDGVTLAAGDRVLVKDQSSGAENGIYVAGATPTRASDMDDADEVLGALVYVIAGTTNAATVWKVTNTSAVTVGTTAIVFAALATGGASFGTPANTYGTPAAGAASTAIRTDAVLPAPDRVVIQATNKSGGSVAAGDVVIVDTANDSAFTTTTTGRAEVTVGIAQATIANNATGPVLISGLASLVPASVTRGHYVETHTVVKQATGSSSRRSGSFGQFLTGGTTPVAVLWGSTDPAASGGSSLTVEELDGSPTDAAVTKIVIPNGYLSIASHVATLTFPSGAASPPASVDGLYAWFKADAISGLSNGATMTEWRNSAPGIAFDLIAFGAPTYQTNVVNSLPVVRLGGSAYFGYVIPALMASKPWTLFIVHKMSSLTPTYTGLWGFGWTDVGGIFVKSNGKTAIYAPASIYDGSGSITYGTVNWNYSTFVFGQTLTSRRSGSADVTGATLALSGGLQGLGYLGNQAVSSRVYSGDIAEVLIYGRVLNATEIAAVESYLSGKYGI